MTREEIINEIKCLLSELDNGEDAVSYLTQNDVRWLNENIKVLEQQPCEDKIIEWKKDFKEYVNSLSMPRDDYKGVMEYIDELPVSPQEHCEDAISRQSLKSKLKEHHDFFVNAYGGFSNLPRNDKSRVDEITNCIAMVVNEPSVKPQESKTGHWIKPYGGNWHCDKCDHEQGRKSNFCPNCGARMIEPQESEDKK